MVSNTSTRILLTSALFALAAGAQSTTISLFLPDTDPQSLVASVIGVDATATTYLINCPAGTDPSDCGYGDGATVIEGPSTLRLVFLQAGTPIETVACDVSGSTAAICTMSQELQGYSTNELLTTSLGPKDITFFQVAVTAGAGLLGGATSTSGGASVSATATSRAAGSATSMIVAAGSTKIAASSTPGSTSSTALLSGSSRTPKAITSSESVSSSTVETQTGASSAGASGNANGAALGRGDFQLLMAVIGCLTAGMLAFAVL